MPPPAIAEAVAFADLEKVWRSACRRTRFSARAYFAAATFFLIGFAKYAYIFPGAHIPTPEALIWLLSATLVLPTLAWFGYDVWREWHIYRRMAAITRHSGIAKGDRWLSHLRLIVDFFRTGRD